MNVKSAERLPAAVHGLQVEIFSREALESKPEQN